ncbi:hypothetical protein KSP39_PZI019052 [Platanthera zijinensis]|uniref:Uncharacterized protein n=1 Tax=Platanthera zijinensis TaxID=2320716 RepID=A0AAP0B0S7_9ASPA
MLSHNTTITFGDEDLEGLRLPNHDPLVISAGIGDFCSNVKRMLVDNGSSVDVLFLSTLESMKLTKKHLFPTARLVYGFDNHPVPVQVVITLPITIGEFSKQAAHNVHFIVIDSSSTYNAIFGRPVQSIFRAIPTSPHLAMKFLTIRGVGVIHRVKEESYACYSKQV